MMLYRNTFQLLSAFLAGCLLGLFLFDGEWSIVAAPPTAQKAPASANLVDSALPKTSTTQHDMARLLCSHVPEPRIAWCFSGTLRTFRLPAVRKSIKYNGIESLGGRADIFMHVQAHDAPRGPRPDRSPLPDNLNLTDARTLVAELNPTRAVIGNFALDPPLNPSCQFDNTTFLGNDNGLRRFVGQWVNIKECFELVTKHEREHGFQYDYVVRARPDVSYITPIPAHCFFRNDAISDCIVDHFFFVPRRMADHVFNLIDWYYNECNTALPPKPMDNSEHVLLALLGNWGYQRVEAPVREVIVRTTGLMRHGTCPGLTDWDTCDRVTRFNLFNNASLWDETKHSFNLP